MGFPAWMLDHLGEEDVEALRYMAAVLEAGFPLVAFLQVLNVYGQSLRQLADAEARLFRLYVHEPLIRDNVPSMEMAEELGDLIRRAAAADHAADGVPAPQLPAPLRRAGRDREHGVGAGRRATTPSASCGWRSRSPTSSASCGSRRRRARRRRVDLVETLRRLDRGIAAAQRPRREEHRRRRDDRRERPCRADGLGDRLPGGLRAPLAPARRRPLRATRSTGTATTSGATSTSRRAWSRARRPARCW